MTERDPDLKRDPSEKVFLDPQTQKTHPFPSIDDLPSVYMTLVVPAYKEQDRCKLEWEDSKWWHCSSNHEMDLLVLHSVQDDGGNNGVFGE